MPNWCSNSMVVYGSSTEVKNFYKKIKSAWQKGDEQKHWHLYQIYEEFGYAEDEILHSSSNGYNRGYFNDITEIQIDKKTGESYFTLYYESAWGSMYEGFDWLLSKHYKTLKQVTLAEECGCEVYINTDVTGRFFSERYCVDVMDYDIYYCDTEEEALDIVKSYAKDVGIEVDFKTIRECEKWLEERDNYIDLAHENMCTSIHEYSCD